MAKLALFGGTPVVPKPLPLSKMFVEYPFEKRFAEYVGAKFALTTGSGTDSIVSALIGAGVQPGDEVITVSHTWFCTATAILNINAVPVFVDVDPDTFMMDPDKIEERITERTKAIVGVSLYGQPADYDRIRVVARKHDLVVIDDACQSTGAAIGDRKLGSGSVADITAFSFSGKPIISSGGGVITTDDRVFYERAVTAGQHPSFVSTHVKDPELWKLCSTGGYGHNYRIDGMCVERAYEQLERLDAFNAFRRNNAYHLTKRLSEVGGIKTPVERPGVHHVYHMYSCLFDGSEHGITRDEFVDALNAEGVWTLTYISGVNFLKTPAGEPFYAGPLHRRHLFQELARTGACGPYRFPDGVRPDYSEGSLPVTEKLVDMEFNIPQRWINPPFDTKTMDRYADAVIKVLDNADEIREAREREGGWKRRHHFVVACESDA